MEACVDSVESAVNAEKGGAARVELCSNLVEGGTTPSLGMFRVIKQRVKIPVFVMIRPRGGDFVYSEDEFSVMKEDLTLLKENGVDGVVFGILTPNGNIDVPRCQELKQLAHPLPVTFHRAFDMLQEPVSALEVLVSLGFERILTSGLEASALEGLPMLESLIKLAKGRIIIVPGGGITEGNLERILSGCGAMEFHASARSARDSAMVYRSSRVTMGASFGPSEFSVKVADESRVTSLVKLAQNCGVHTQDLEITAK